MKKTKKILSENVETANFIISVVPFKAVENNGKFYVALQGFLVDKQGNKTTTDAHEYRSMQVAQNAADFLNKTKLA